MEQTDSEDLTIRLAGEGDRGALRRLAERDTASVHAGPSLVAAVGDEIRAAVPLRGGAALADPFHPTADLVKVLRVRARQLRGDQPSGWRMIGRRFAATSSRRRTGVEYGAS